MDLSAATARLLRATLVLLFLLATRTQAQTIALSEEEMRWLREHPAPVRVGIIEIPPLVMRDGNGYRGMAIEFLRLYESRVGFRSEIVRYPDWKALIAAARAREVDAVLTTVNTTERRAYLGFPAPYVTLQNVIIARQGESSGKVDLSQLAGRRVAVLESSAVHERLIREYPDVRPLPFRDERAMLTSVGLHEADFAITELSRALWWIDHDKLATLRVAGDTPFDYPLSLAVRSEWPELVTALDKAGRSIAGKEGAEVIRRWVHLDASTWLDEPANRNALTAIGLATALALSGLLAAVVLLRRRLGRQAVELRRQLAQEEAVRIRLESSERKFRELAELTSDLIWETDAKLVFTEVYGGGAEAPLFAEAAMIGKAWWDMPLAEASGSALAEISGLMHDCEPFRSRLAQWQDDAGRTRWLKISGHPVFDELGRLEGYRGTAQDITQRMTQQQQLAESVQRMQAVQDGTVSFLGLLSPDGRMLDSNRASLEFVGVSKAEVLGRYFWDLPWWKIAEEATRLRDAVARARSGETVRYDARVVDGVGAVHWVDLSLNPFYDDAGRLIYLVPEGRDITEAKRTSFLVDNLLTSTGAVYGEEYFRRLVEAMGKLLSVRTVLIARVTPNHHSVRTLALWSGGRVVDNIEFPLENSPCELVKGGQCCIYPRNVQEAFPGNLLLRQMGADAYIGVPITSGAGRSAGLLVVLHDKPLLDTAGARRLMELFALRAGTEMDRIAYESEIRLLNSGLEARVAERTEALQQVNRELEAFSYSVSHDLRAPLRHIAGFVEMLAEDPDSSLSPEGRRFVTIIGDAARRMGVMIDDLLALSRAGRASLRKTPVDLTALAGEVVGQARLGLEGRTVDFHVGPLPVVNADRGLITLVLANLVSNAVKYSRERNPATIAIETASVEDGSPAVVVRDNGIGFDMKYASKLFGVFQRLHADSDYEGTGIGLANVRRIIERHGGRVWAEAAPGQGAAFYFSLPREDVVQAPQALAA
jgi:PAS domain S-box-containing protein